MRISRTVRLMLNFLLVQSSGQSKWNLLCRLLIPHDSGNEELEANLPLSVVPWSAIGINDTCQDCTVNEAAAAAYMEVKQATNDFAATRERYAGAGVCSVRFVRNST